MKKNAKIYVAGHTGLVGRAIMRCLQKNKYSNIITQNHSELDLRNQDAVYDFFIKKRPEYVFLAAAKVGGIFVNSKYPATFIYDNIMINTNIIDASYKYGVKKLLFLGSSCIYPSNCPQPIKEEYLLTGPLEKTNKSYAIAKIAGINMCQSYNRQYGANFISVMPTNLYGPYDNFDLKTSHVLPALIRKIHEAKISNKKKVVIWGTGKSLREFLYVDDLADALLFLMQNYDESEIINIGTGKDVAIANVALLIKEIIGFDGKFIFDKSKPNGVSKKQLNIDKLTKLGWQAQISLQNGIKKTYTWCLKNYMFVSLFDKKSCIIKSSISM